METRTVELVVNMQQRIRALGETPVKAEPWELDDDGLMYLNSLTEQYEDTLTGADV